MEPRARGHERTKLRTGISTGWVGVRMVWRWAAEGGGRALKRQRKVWGIMRGELIRAGGWTGALAEKGRCPVSKVARRASSHE